MLAILKKLACRKWSWTRMYLPSDKPQIRPTDCALCQVYHQQHVYKRSAAAADKRSTVVSRDLCFSSVTCSSAVHHRVLLNTLFTAD